MQRIDMSEYMEKHGVARLIGAPPGYVGYEEGGVLTEAVRRRPYQVVLFDEIEKAHGDVFNILLQVLDDGRLTDGHGRTVDFSNCIIILTSNLGAEQLAALPEGEDSSAAQATVMAMVRGHFRPEFLNRLDEILLFHRLARGQMGRIVEIQIERLRRLLEDRKMSLTLDEAAVQWLAEAGYDPVYGARPLKRVIQRRLQNPLAELILEGRTDQRRGRPRWRRRSGPHHQRPPGRGGVVPSPPIGRPGRGPCSARQTALLEFLPRAAWTGVVAAHLPVGVEGLAAETVKRITLSHIPRFLSDEAGQYPKVGPRRVARLAKPH